MNNYTILGLRPWWADVDVHPTVDIDYSGAESSLYGSAATPVEAVAEAIEKWNGIWEDKDARLAYWTGILEERCDKLSNEITAYHVAIERMARKARDA